ncbi:MAG: hypothetical protein JRJ59_05090 [Deltaproteobacteria bacterium]|nr:hypothetical protein [Deltaproteobacteria bacterium]
MDWLKLLEISAWVGAILAAIAAVAGLILSLRKHQTSPGPDRLNGSIEGPSLNGPDISGPPS